LKQTTTLQKLKKLDNTNPKPDKPVGQNTRNAKEKQETGQSGLGRKKGSDKHRARERDSERRRETGQSDSSNQTQPRTKKPRKTNPKASGARNTKKQPRKH